MIGLGAFLLGLALYILGRDGRALKKVEAQQDNMIAGGITKHQGKAEKLNKKAAKHDAGAKAAAAATLARLEKNSEIDNDMDDLLSAFESERVRQQQSG